MSWFPAPSLQHLWALERSHKRGLFSAALFDGVWRYGLAVIGILAAIGFGLLQQLVDLEVANYFGFYAAVAIAVWFGGVGPGCMSIVLATMAVEYFFTAPLYTLSVEARELPGFVFFVLCAVASLAVSARLRHMER